MSVTRCPACHVSSPGICATCAAIGRYNRREEAAARAAQALEALRNAHVGEASLAVLIALGAERKAALATLAACTREVAAYAARRASNRH